MDSSVVSPAYMESPTSIPRSVHDCSVKSRQRPFPCGARDCLGTTLKLPVATDNYYISITITAVVLSSDGRSWRQLSLVTTDITGLRRQSRLSLPRRIATVTMGQIRPIAIVKLGCTCGYSAGS
jgi:hypothetical protein